MSEPALRRPSFLSLVPVWQRLEMPLTEKPEHRERRWSEVSVASFSSSRSSASDYGENGFLVLTANTNSDELEEE